jgi:hypothetical protein
VLDRRRRRRTVLAEMEAEVERMATKLAVSLERHALAGRRVTLTCATTTSPRIGRG